MNVNIIRGGILTLIIVEAFIALMITREILILLTLGLTLAMGILLRDAEYWGFYTFAGAIPLLVIVGGLYPPAGGIILVTALGFIFLDSYQNWNRQDRIFITLLILAIISAMIVTPFITGVTGLGTVFLFIVITGSAFAIFRNRLLKRHYLGDTG